jgi:hypothetical protein
MRGSPSRLDDDSLTIQRGRWKQADGKTGQPAKPS